MFQKVGEKSTHNADTAEYLEALTGCQLPLALRGAMRHPDTRYARLHRRRPDLVQMLGKDRASSPVAGMTQGALSLPLVIRGQAEVPVSGRRCKRGGLLERHAVPQSGISGIESLKDGALTVIFSKAHGQ
jgi:hypothetical protein